MISSSSSQSSSEDSGRGAERSASTCWTRVLQEHQKMRARPSRLTARLRQISSFSPFSRSSPHASMRCRAAGSDPMIAISCGSLICSCSRMKTRREATLFVSVEVARSRTRAVADWLLVQRATSRMRSASSGSWAKTLALSLLSMISETRKEGIRLRLREAAEAMRSRLCAFSEKGTSSMAMYLTRRRARASSSSGLPWRAAGASLSVESTYLMASGSLNFCSFLRRRVATAVLLSRCFEMKQSSMPMAFSDCASSCPSLRKSSMSPLSPSFTSAARLSLVPCRHLQTSHRALLASCPQQPQGLLGRKCARRASISGGESCTLIFGFCFKMKLRRIIASGKEGLAWFSGVVRAWIRKAAWVGRQSILLSVFASESQKFSAISLKLPRIFFSPLASLSLSHSAQVSHKMSTALMEFCSFFKNIMDLITRKQIICESSFQCSGLKSRLLPLGSIFGRRGAALEHSRFRKRRSGLGCNGRFSIGQLSSAKPMINLYNAKIATKIAYFAPSRASWPTTKPAEHFFRPFRIYCPHFRALIVVQDIFLARIYYILLLLDFHLGTGPAIKKETAVCYQSFYQSFAPFYDISDIYIFDSRKD